MALVSQRCSIGNTLAMASTHIIPQKVNLSPNKLNRLLIPQQGKQFSNLSYRRGSHLKKKMLHTVRAASEQEGEESEWSKMDNRRFLGATFRVSDLERSIKYYTQVLGMTLFGRRNLIGVNAAFVGFDTPDSQILLELIYRTQDPVPFDIGTGFGHLGISTPDIDQYVSDIKAKGGIITVEPTGPGPTENAFAQDPDGYLIELVERRIQHLRISHLNLRITNLQLSTDFYEGVLLMKLLMSIPIPEAKATLHLMGYSDKLEAVDYKELPTTYLELLYADDGTGQYTKGNAYSHLSIGTDDVNKSADALKLAAQKLGVGVVSEEPQSSITTKSTAITFLDPDRWTIVFYDNEEFDKEIKGNQ